MTCIEVANPQELNLEENSEMQTEEESFTFQDWINQSHKMKYDLSKHISQKSGVRMINHEKKIHIKKSHCINLWLYF